METGEEMRSDLAIPPGAFLEEVLEEVGLSRSDLASRMALSAQTIDGIVEGTEILTPGIAHQLEQVVGVPAYIWLGLESEYRLVLRGDVASSDGADPK